MGLKRKLMVGALAFGSVTFVGVPMAGAATPSNLIGNSEYAAVSPGMSVEHVSALVAQPLVFKLEQRDTFPDGEMVQQLWTFEGQLGNCRQIVVFTFDNVDADGNFEAFGLESKSQLQAECQGIIK